MLEFGVKELSDIISAKAGIHRFFMDRTYGIFTLRYALTGYSGRKRRKHILSRLDRRESRIEGCVL